MKPQQILSITNDQRLGEAIVRFCASQSDRKLQVYSLTYEEQSSLVSEGLLHGIDLFLLELFRRYPEGLRAEGAPTAQRLEAAGRCCLVFSYLSVSDTVRDEGYWDLMAEDSLAERILWRLGSARVAAPVGMKLARHFRSWLRVPERHC